MSEKRGLTMKYFVLKPGGKSKFAHASRSAMLKYAEIIQGDDQVLAQQIRDWVYAEMDAATLDETVSGCNPEHVIGDGIVGE